MMDRYSTILLSVGLIIVVNWLFRYYGNKSDIFHIDFNDLEMHMTCEKTAYMNIPHLHEHLEEPVDLRQPVKDVLSSIDKQAEKMPKMGLTVVLPNISDGFTMATTQDIYNLAPQGFSLDPIILMNKEYREPVRSYSMRFRNTYVIETIAGMNTIIQSFYYVKSVSKYRNRVLLLTADSIVDWEKFVDEGLDKNTDLSVQCLVRGEEVVLKGKCDSFNAIYPISAINSILQYFSKNGLDNTLETPSEWYRWVNESVGVGVVPIKGILSGVYDLWEDDKLFYENIMRRDPRYADLMLKDKDMIKDEMSHIINRLYKVHVDYLKEPEFVRIPDSLKCEGENGVIMVQSQVNRPLIRDIHRQYFKTFHISEYFFLVGNDNISEELEKEIAVHQDIVIYDNVDSYSMLVYKMFASMTFVKKYCPNAKALIKIDHDTFMAPSQVLVKGTIPFGTPGAQIDFDQYEELNCLYSSFNENDVLRHGLPYSKYSVPNKVWPFTFHPAYCSGPLYMIQMEPMLRIQKALKTFNWFTDPSVVFSYATTNEDSMVTGTFREVAGVKLGASHPCSVHIEVQGPKLSADFERLTKIELELINKDINSFDTVGDVLGVSKSPHIRG